MAQLGAERPEIMVALLDEAKKVGFGSTAHLQQGGVAQMNAIKAARLGSQYRHAFLRSLRVAAEGLRRAAVAGRHERERRAVAVRAGRATLEQDRRTRLPGVEGLPCRAPEARHGIRSDVDDLFGWPRPLKFRNAEWHDKYTLPSLMDFYTPSRAAHGSYWYYWTTEDEVEWRNFYQVWFKLVNDYKNMGGRVTSGSDSGFIYQTYGFGYVKSSRCCTKPVSTRSRSCRPRR